MEYLVSGKELKKKNYNKKPTSQQFPQHPLRPGTPRLPRHGCRRLLAHQRNLVQYAGGQRGREEER